MADTDKDLKDAFALFDRNGDGVISAQEVGTVLRALGRFPTEAEVQEIVKDLGSEKVDFEKVKTLMGRVRRDIEEREVREALKIFDPEGKGMVSAESVRVVLSSTGEKMDPKDIDSIIQPLEENGNVSIDKLVAVLVPKDSK
eukprot:TRINITY_DN1534_c0_g1_i2.p1 TRINITY_DN1534_c0_g1~~TRINITY_DN1534_c0_g1_i2.p1  ORF type:complete len:142 (-),score=43.08 TRINITY_DN1534_c0_g1_i2:84-509(-)